MLYRLYQYLYHNVYFIVWSTFRVKYYDILDLFLHQVNFLRNQYNITLLSNKKPSKDTKYT